MNTCHSVCAKLFIHVHMYVILPNQGQLTSDICSVSKSKLIVITNRHNVNPVADTCT